MVTTELTELVKQAGLAPAHERALLRLPEGIREAALIEMAYLGLGPEQAEAYADAVLGKRSADPLLLGR